MIKTHSITLSTKNFEGLRRVQRLIPIKVSIPQKIEYLTKCGLKYLINNKDIDNGTNGHNKKI